MEVTFIFPHQLFEENPAVSKRRQVFLIEEHLFFNQYRFHKQKLAFHRASMKCYQSYLNSRGLDVRYIDATSPESDVRVLFAQKDLTKIHFIDPVDNYLSRRIKTSCLQQGIDYQEYDSPCFINTWNDLGSFFNPSKKKFFQTEFYIQQRKALNILLNKSGDPAGGKWSFDKENRKKYPKQRQPPSIQYPDQNPIYREAIEYVETNYPNNPGKLTTQPIYPFDYKSSKEWVEQFLECRFNGFGDYEDSLVANEHFLNHSLFSPLINSGLLSPVYVIERVIEYAAQKGIAINNTEGLIRQIIGWREFIRGVYVVKGSEERTRNYWGFKRKIPDSFYQGTTGIDPVDITIKKLLETGYNHHIERLMILGNFMLLCEFDPDEVYRWFMEMYVDAYDWAMVPNVYGMSQFADGGLMSTKPYISGSNYLVKMSDYPKGEWQKVWDGLFWRFMHVHSAFFESNPRLGMLLKTFDRMDKEKQSDHLNIADEFIDNL